MVFTAIEPAPGLTTSARRRALEFAPDQAGVRTSYPSLLRSARFVDVSVEDVTGAYRETLLAWCDATERRWERFVTALGRAEAEERMARRRGALRAVDDGLLRRTRYVARRTVTR
jgi:hypothetical protein